MDKIEDVMFPAFGEKYLVCHAVICVSYLFAEIPIINHLHNDKENGQTEKHYHIDDRFDYQKVFVIDRVIHELNQIRLSEMEVLYVSYKGVKYHPKKSNTRTPLHLISNSKLKHDCIYKGKCPHRGFDLSNTPARDGVITCPLHSLRFEAVSKKIIE